MTYDEGIAEVKRKTKIQPKWKNSPSCTDLKADYTSAESGMEEFRAKLTQWAETRNGGAEIKTSGVGKSTARPKLVRKNNEWKYSALEDPLLSTTKLFNVSGATYADVDAGKQNASILNYQWNTKVKKTKLVGDIVRTVVDEGTVIVKTGWDSETDIIEVEEKVPVFASPEQSITMMQQAVSMGKMSAEEAQAMIETGEPMVVGSKFETVEREVLVKNQPSYEVCVTANVTIDPTCDGVVEDALFVIHEYDTSWAELKENEYYKDEEGEEYGSYHNLSFIKEQTSEEYDEHLSDESNNFEFKDKARKRMKAYEYWGYWDIQGDGELVSIVATWVGSTLIRLEENPFPHGRLPFSVATYMPVKKSVHGEPDAELLKENQDSIGKMTRAIHDITARNAVGQEFIDEQFFPSPSQKNSYEKGNTVFYRTGFDPKRAIHRNEIQQIGSTPFDVINWQATDASELTGTRAFSGPGGAKMNGSKQDRDSMDATAKRELGILRRISDMLVDMAKMTVAMNQVFLDETEVVRITDKEFVEIKRDDLQGDFDLRVQVSTPEKDDDQADKLMTMLQTNAASMDPNIVKRHYIKLAELWKMDDLAEELANYEPQPDPAQQELMALQIEEQKLKNALAQKQLEDYDSKIYERLSRTDENANADATLKQAKAEQALATAAKIESETDILDQSFVYLETGDKRRAEIEDMEYKAQVDAAAKEQETLAQAGIKHLENSLSRTPGKVVSEI